jgi:hypothetical protein
MTAIIRRRDAGALNRIIDNVRSMGLNKVEVGLPSGGRHSGTDLSMHELGMVHEYGSPTRNIPARPFIGPPIADNVDKYKKIMRKQAARLLFRRTSLHNALSLVGEAGKADIQKYMLSANFKPLAASTIEAKGSSKPLIDSGQMRNAITYEITR